MSMIGLLAGAPQAATAKSAGGDATAAEGFGSTLQGALDALAETATEALPADVSSPPVDSPTGGMTLPSTLPLVELAETSTLVSIRSQSDLLNPQEGSSTGSLPLVEIVETPADATPASGNSADQPVPVAPLPPAPLVKPSTGNPSPAAANSVSESSATPPATPAQLSGTPTGYSVAASAASANVAVGTPRPASPSANTTSGASLPTARPTDAGASFGTGGVAPSSTTDPLPAAPAPTTTFREAPVSTAPVQPPTHAIVEDAPAPASVAAPAAPVGAPQPVAPAAVVTAPAAAASVPFATQLARPIFSLAAAGAGEHVMTVSVTPDNLGPVTVRAHVGAEGVRVELFAPNDLGRDAIRAIIPELRRDLAGAGLGGNLSLSPQNQPSPEGSAHGSNAGQPGERDGRLAAGSVPASADSGLAQTEQQVDRSGLFGTTSTIDVLA